MAACYAYVGAGQPRMQLRERAAAEMHAHAGAQTYQPQHTPCELDDVWIQPHQSCHRSVVYRTATAEVRSVINAAAYSACSLRPLPPATAATARLHSDSLTQASAGMQKIARPCLCTGAPAFATPSPGQTTGRLSASCVQRMWHRQGERQCKDTSLSYRQHED